MKKFYILILIISFFNQTEGQISLNFPMERQIFQRNNSNQAFIHISGNFTSDYDSITAKVTPRVIGQGTESSWQKVCNRNSKPYFLGKISAIGGWYKLAVKAFKDGLVIDSIGRARVGVGEVFVIAGQSNATGTTNTSGQGLDTDEDRSNVMSYANLKNDYNALPFGFSPMDIDSVASDTVIVGPFQLAPWCWGKLSEELVDSLNVPVLIYGAGFGGTRIAWWYQSAYNLPFDPERSPPPWVQSQYQHPYGALGSVMKMYASLTGIRAVLWHQGEADHGTSASWYQFYLEQVIAKTREQIEVDTLAWMVARASYSEAPAANVILGQNQTILNDVNVFAGPPTDNLTGTYYRSDNIHLDTGPGLAEHANLWFNYITNGFLSSSTPILAQDFLELNFACNPGNPSEPITLSSPASYSGYAWSNRDNTNSESLGYTSDGNGDYTVLPPLGYNRLNWGFDSTSSINVGAGRYSLNVRKPISGKMLFSSIVDLTTLTLPTNPVFLSSASQIRLGDTLTLTGSNCNGLYKWNTGGIINPLVLYPSVTANYTVECKTLHCLSSASDPTQVIVSSCFPNSLNLTGGVFNAQSPFQSQLVISSIQKLANTGKLDYTANQSITLNPGFQASAGAIFKASIENCP
jgi:hypothetical protein